MKLLPIGFSLPAWVVVFTLFTALKATSTTNEWYPGGSGFTGWPTNWVEISSLNDPRELSTANARLDFVGDAQNPGAYWSANTNYFFIRMRVAVSNVTSTTFRDSLWIYIDRVDFTNGTAAPNMPDYALVWDSKSNDPTKHGLELMTGVDLSAKSYWSQMQLNDIDAVANDKIAPPDFNLTGDGYIRTIDMSPTTNLGYTTYIDFAVKWSFIKANTALDMNQQWKFQFGSRNDSTDHNFPQDDIAGGFSPDSLVASSWASPSGPLSSSIGFSVYATSTNVMAELSLVNETGSGDLVVQVWQDNAWSEVGRLQMAADALPKADTTRYFIPLSGLTAGSTYIFKVVDEVGNAFYLSQTVQTRVVKLLALGMADDTITVSFATEEDHQYAVFWSSDLVTWTPETVRYPTFEGWSEPASTPFTAGPGTQTQVLVPKNGREKAFFRTERVDW